MAEPLAWNDSDFAREVEHRSGTPVSACYQCHKCTSGCPIGPEMDLLPSQIMRLICLGAEREVLECRSIWLCASCETCTTRCPMGIDIAAVMDTLRMLAIERAAAIPDTHGRSFNRSFLKSVRRRGRVYELGMMAGYKLRCGDLLSDVGKLPTMLKKGKLAIMPHASGAARQLREIYKRAEEEETNR